MGIYIDRSALPSFRYAEKSFHILILLLLHYWMEFNGTFIESFSRKKWYFTFENDGLQNQSVTPYRRSIGLPQASITV